MPLLFTWDTGTGTQGRFFCPILKTKWDKRTVPVSHFYFLYYVKDRAIMDFSLFSFDPNIKKKCHHR